MRRAVYPGSFDPITNGHHDMIRRGAKLYDELIVAAAVNTSKTPIFDMDERVEMIRGETGDLPNVRVESFDGLAVEFARSRGAQVILRGIRSFSDFEYELQLAHTNSSIAPDIETVFMLSSVEWSFVSARLLREAVIMGGDVGKFVSPRVLDALKQRLAGASGR